MAMMVQRAWYAVLQVFAQALFVVLFRGRAFHRERIPAAGGVLVVCNHQSYLDPILAALPIYRPFSPMARDSLFRFKPFAWLIRSLHAFPVRRGAADMSAMRTCIRRLREGGIVLVFPEGTRTRDGSIGRLHAGIVLAAQRAGVPIVPAVIDGAFEAWPRGAALPRPHPVRVNYGEPIPPGEVRRMRPEELAHDIRRRMVDLQHELRDKEADQ